MSRRPRTSSKARALAATAGFALALTPAGLALADTGQTVAPTQLEQPAQPQDPQTVTPASSNTTPAESPSSPVVEQQVPSGGNSSDNAVPSQDVTPSAPETTTPAGSDAGQKATEPSQTVGNGTPSEDVTTTPSQTQDTNQKSGEGQSTVDEGAGQTASSTTVETDTNSAGTKSGAEANSAGTKSGADVTGTKSGADVAGTKSDADVAGTKSGQKTPEPVATTKEPATKADAPTSESSVVEAQGRQAALKDVKIDAHVQNVGWTGTKTGQAGTTGQGLRMEAVRIKLVDEDGSEVKGVSYKAHVQNVGWMQWVDDGAIGGTTGQSLRIEAIKLALSDDLAKQYDIVYRVHVQNLGWLDWTSNGAAAGTTGQSLRIESIGAYLQRKNSAKIGSGKAAFYGVDNSKPAVYLTSHVQDIGWTGVSEGSAGTTGRGLRLEAFTAKLDGVRGGISYSSHVQNEGWMKQVSNGAVSGTTGKGQRVEAASFVLTGDAAIKYDVYYRAHVQDYGWLGWSKNGEGLGIGTQGLSKRMEALQIRLVAKGGAAPSNGDACMNASFIVPVGVTYATSPGSEWSQQVSNGGTSGTFGSPLERVRASVAQAVNTVGTPQGGISYQVQSSNGAWSNWSSNNNVAGSLGADARAIKFSLNGELSKAFNVYYRAHVTNRGWLGWAANGADAGMTNSEKVDAINVVLVAKGNAAPSNTSSTYTAPLLTPNWKSNTIDSYLNWAVGIANDNGHGYSQYDRWGPDYDCSSLVISALKHAGLNTGSAITTHNMKQELTQYGWEALPFTSLEKLQRGDILLNVQNHTELYLGGGKNVAARISELGTIYGAVGDQTGEEIMVKDFTIYGHGGWDYALRLRG